MKKKYYKVVSVNDKKQALTSYIFDCFNKVTYKVGEWVDAPDNSRLFVFDSLESAMAFAWNDQQIYECEIVGGITGYGWIGGYSSDPFRFWEEINNILKRKKKVDFDEIRKKYTLCDTRSVLAKKVKLVKLVRSFKRTV